MAALTFSIISRDGESLFYTEFNREQNLSGGQADDQKLLYGMLFSLKVFTQQMSFTGAGTMQSYSTNSYKMHYFEPSTGLRFVLLSAPTEASHVATLQHIYSEIYVPCVARNPLHTPGDQITPGAFTERLAAVVAERCA